MSKYGTDFAFEICKTALVGFECSGIVFEADRALVCQDCYGVTEGIVC